MSQQFFKITVDNNDESFRCSEQTSLLSGMEKERKKAFEIGCRGGGCGICKIKILDGNYNSKKMSIKHVSKEEANQGFALACRVFPTSEMLIESLQ